jgi:hypothetical protein
MGNFSFKKKLYVFFRSLEYLFGYGFMKHYYYEVCRNIIKLYYNNQYLLVLVSFSSNILLCESLNNYYRRLCLFKNMSSLIEMCL